MTHARKHLAIVVALSALSAGSAGAVEHCYDFSKLAVDTRYKVGDAVQIGIGTVRIRQMPRNGAPDPHPSAQNRFLSVSQQQLAQGSAPEVHGSQVAMQILASRPVRSIRMKLAQQLGGGGLPAFLEVNGELHDFEGSFQRADGKTLGLGGKAEMRVALVADAAPSAWHRGTLGVRAKSGGIKTFSIGAQSFSADDICIEH